MLEGAIKMTNNLALKDLALNLKDSIIEEKDLDLEEYTATLSEQSGINHYDIKDMYNNMFLVYNTTVDESVKRRLWTDVEDNLIIQYVAMSKKVDKTIRESLEDLEDLLISRTAVSIIFRYYNVLTAPSKRKKSKKSTTRKPKKLVAPKGDKPVVEDNSNAEEQIVEVVESEVEDKLNTDEKISEAEADVVVQEQPLSDTKANDEDLIDVVSEIVENVENANVDVSSLFKDILTLSRKAVENNNDLERVKSLEKELQAEKEYNKILKSEYNLLLKDLDILKEEIKKYDEMTSKEKLKNFREHSNTVKYIVDQFGTVSKSEEKQSL